MTTGDYFLTHRGFALLAHRGLVLPGSGLVENTLLSFKAALDAGATHIETDVQATKDGVAVLFHDRDLLRLTGDKRRVDQVDFAVLDELCQDRGFAPLSLADAVSRFPTAKFNLDIKSWNAVQPTANRINELQAYDRVLVSSFSDARRISTIGLLDKQVATSGGAATVLKARLSDASGARRMFKASLFGVDALQIPVRMYGVPFATERFVSGLRGLGVEVHFWTVNDPAQANHLLNLGASGLVSDRVDLLSPLLGNS